MSTEARDSIASVISILRQETAKISNHFLMEAFVMGREAHSALCKKRQVLRNLELSEHLLQEKFGALGIPESHPLFKEKMDALHAASSSLDGDIRAEVENETAEVEAKIKALELKRPKI